jgi:hypothetical protein
MTGTSPSVPHLDSAATDEAVRRTYISHEASVKSIGILYFLSATIILLGTFGMVLRDSEELGTIELGAIVVIFPALAITQIAAGIGVRKLTEWGKYLSTIVSALGLLGFPVGTLINGYILYLLHSKKGRYVFSPEYKRIIAATPGVKYKTSILVWIFLAFLVLVFGGAVILSLVR